MKANDAEIQHLRTVNCFLPQQEDGLEGVLEHGIDDAAEIEADLIYMSPILQHGGNSTYANSGGNINPAFIKGNYGYQYNRNLMHAILNKAHSKGVAIAFDIVLNHISKDSALFEAERVHELKYDPVQGKIAAAVARGDYQADDIFAPVEIKRHEEARKWLDVREIRLDGEERIRRAIKDFMIPLVDTHLDLVPEGMEEVVFRIDTPSQLLLTDRPGDEGYAIYQIFSAISQRCKEKGITPKFLFETLGGSPENYKKVLDSLPEDVRANTFHFSDSMYGYSDKKKIDPGQVRTDISNDNNHDFHKKHHLNKTMFGDRQINFVATHDTPAGECDLPYYLGEFQLNAADIKMHANFYMALSYLSAPNYMVTYAMLKKNYGYKQPVDTVCGHIDFSQDKDTPKDYLKNIGKTHKELYKNRSSFAWSELAIDPNNAKHSILIFWPDYEREQAPVYVVMNADPHATDLANRRDMAEFVKTTAQANAARKGQEYKEPEEVYLLGEFTPKQMRSLALDQGRIIINGDLMRGIKSAYDQNAEIYENTGTYGLTNPGIKYSPENP